MDSIFNRRDFLKTIGAAAAGLALPGCSGFFTNPQSKKVQRPNVLFICVDDLNDWIGCLGGHPDTKTPNIDSLAERGVLFTNAHCAAPACNPSRAGLMTGIRPSTSGIYGNHQPWRKSPVLREAVTLPQHFMNHGYYAAGSGKIYHGRYPDPASWDQYWPSKDLQRPEDPKPSKRPLKGIPRPSPWGPIDVADAEMGDWKVTDWVCGQLGKKHEKPFFLGCGTYRPHLPWYVPKKYFDLHPLEEVTLPNVKQDDLDDVPPIGRKWAKAEDYKKIVDHDQWRKGVQAYLACVSFADECVGKVIDALDASEYADNTIIVLWSDNGLHFGEKLRWYKKQTLWEESTRVPLIFVVPGMTKRASRCSRPVSLMDIYPTLSEICGLEPKSELEGVSIAALLKDPQRKWDRPALATWGRNNHSLRSERWRYTRYSDGTEELYDHDNDANEWYNLADKPEYDQIKVELAKWLPKVNAE